VDTVDLEEPRLAADSHGAFGYVLDLVVAAQADGWHPDLEPKRLAGALGDPLGELARLLDAADAYDRFNRASDGLFAGDAQAALAEADEGLATVPGEGNLAFLRAAALLARGDLASSCGGCWPATQPGRSSCGALPPRACCPCRRRVDRRAARLTPPSATARPPPAGRGDPRRPKGCRAPEARAHPDAAGGPAAPGVAAGR
jgi:hypothetical protein